LNTVAQGFSILLFYTICTFYSQTRSNAAKAETNKTIVDIERISDCILRLNIAKSGFYNFESGAFNHSATLPHKLLLKTHCAAFRNEYIVRAFASGASSFATSTLVCRARPQRVCKKPKLRKFANHDSRGRWLDDELRPNENGGIEIIFGSL
jgi:hypothetical protein